jgi:hypothetical protein
MPVLITLQKLLPIAPRTIYSLANKVAAHNGYEEECLKGMLLDVSVERISGGVFQDREELPAIQGSINTSTGIALGIK